MTSSLLTLVSVLSIAQPTVVQRFHAPSFEGGTYVELNGGHKISVWSLETKKLRWSLSMGKAVEALLIEKTHLIVRTGSQIRAIARGVALWSLDLKEKPVSWALVGDGQLKVRLSRGDRWIDSSAGHLCSKPAPCKVKRIAKNKPRHGHQWQIHRDVKRQIEVQESYIVRPIDPERPVGVVGAGQLFYPTRQNSGTVVGVPLASPVLNQAGGAVEVFPSGRNATRVELDKEKRVRKISNH